MNKKSFLRNAAGVAATAASILPPLQWGLTILTGLTTVVFFIVATAIFAKD